MSRKITDDEYFIHFWSQVDRSGGPKACWNWTGGTSYDGYGNATHFGLQKAHRIAWYYANGNPGKKYVLHNCDNPSCCNPCHLRLGTHEDNVRDMMERGRHRWLPNSNAAAMKLGEHFSTLASLAVQTADGNWVTNVRIREVSDLIHRGYIEAHYTDGIKTPVRITPAGLLSLAVLTATVYLDGAA